MRSRLRRAAAAALTLGLLSSMPSPSALTRAGAAAYARKGAVGPPLTPSGLSAHVTGSTVTLRWTPTAGPQATTLLVQGGSIPGGTDHGAVAVITPSLTVFHVGTGVYYVRVIALNDAGASAPTRDLAVVVGDGLPAAPIGLGAAGGPGGRVRVFWQPLPGLATIVGYVLLAGQTPGAPTVRMPLTTPALVTERVPSGTYYVRVAAVSAAGTGPFTGEITVVVP